MKDLKKALEKAPPAKLNQQTKKRDQKNGEEPLPVGSDDTGNFCQITLTVRKEDRDWLKRTAQENKRLFSNPRLVSRSSLVRLGILQLQKSKNLKDLITKDMLDCY